MSQGFISHIQAQLDADQNDGLYKKDRITSQQSADITVTGDHHVINL